MRTGRAVVAIHAVVLLTLACSGLEGRAAKLTDRMREITGSAASLVNDAGVAGDIALRALENALAQRNEAEGRFVAALRRGRDRDVESANDRMTASAEEAVEACELARQVFAAAARCSAAAESARAEAKKALDAAERDAESVARSAEKLLSSAEKDLKKARSLVNTMKTKWLVPTNLTRKGNRSPTAGDKTGGAAE